MNDETYTRIRLGMLTPSSNTVLEPVTTEMINELRGVSAHFSRFRVTQIGLSASDLDQFSHREILRASDLLADAKVDVIAWNGTSASWLGFERDEALCAQILESTGIAACTSVLAFREVFERTRVRKIGLVTPYVDDVQRRIMRNWGASGFDCAAERHLGLSDNFSFAEVGETVIADMVRDVARKGCDAVAVVCTNLAGARIAAALEKEIGAPVYDSISITVWKSLRLAGFATHQLSRWGHLFRDANLNPHGIQGCSLGRNEVAEFDERK
jgi:maleate isomerase